MATDDVCKEQPPIEEICETAVWTKPRRALPWGIRFRFESDSVPSPSLTVVRAAVDGELPGWEIRPSVAEDGWFEAVPPSLPDYVDDPILKGRFACRLRERLRRITCLHGVKKAHPLEGLPDELVRAFLNEGRESSAVDEIVKELAQIVANDDELHARFLRWRPGNAQLSLLHRLLKGRPSDAIDGEPMSAAFSWWLRDHLESMLQSELERIGNAPWVKAVDPETLDPKTFLRPAKPPARQLRAYSFDPNLATTLNTAPIHQVTIPTRWEPLQRGPVGEYLEVIDIDAASGCAYLPVDLDDPHIVAQDGLPPSEGNPQFHQQMVYAVAMNTIQRFERALGRPVFWSPLRPWLHDEEKGWFPPTAEQPHDEREGKPKRSQDGLSECGDLDIEWKSRFVQRLRIYPHALREANAYYSPTKRALLFGYFPNEVENNGMVFTCLSHDIIVHETTHAIVDGMHSYFNEQSNVDVWAFHEAFADIMALFQHFTYPEVLRHQIAATRGDLEIDNLLGQMAQQFGKATGRQSGLRNYLGGTNNEGKWERKEPDPQLLRDAYEPHERGSILVSAVFDAFLALYNTRVRDLYRIATGGTGVLPAGQIHPDLANRLAEEAAATAEEVLSICIRAMDYLPPVDVTFGEFLRALITADFERFSMAGHENRIAFIDAFRSWGIYPQDVSTLSEESLRWRGAEPDSCLQKWLDDELKAGNDFMDRVREMLDEWRPGAPRDRVFVQAREEQARFYCLLRNLLNKQENKGQDEEILPGLDLGKDAEFNVDNMRPTRSMGPQGELRTAMIVEVVQKYQPLPGAGDDDGPARRRRGEPPVRGGATLVIDLQSWKILYIIYKRLYRKPPCQRVLSTRGARQMASVPQTALRMEAKGNLVQRLAATYASSTEQTWSGQKEPFALLHRAL